MITSTVSYRSSSISASASLLRAIRDDRYEDFPELLEEAKAQTERLHQQRQTTTSTMNGSSNNDLLQHNYRHPLWETNSLGWTPMHAAAIGAPTMPLKWWNWILRQQHQQYNYLSSPSSSSFRSTEIVSQLLWTKQTDTGHTVVELFFLMALDPLPWCRHSLKEQAERLKSSIERILGDRKIGNNSRNNHSEHKEQVNHLIDRDTTIDEDTDSSKNGMLEKLRQLVLEDHQDERNDEPSSREEEKTSEMDNREPAPTERANDDDVAMVLLFWRKLTALLDPPAKQHINKSSRSILDMLAGLPWCPEIVARLAIALVPEQVSREETQSSDSDDEKKTSRVILPLHKCVLSSHGTIASPRPKGMLKVLCEAHPAAAGVPFVSGRLPLHAALVSGQHSWEESLRHIFEAHPPSASKTDGVTGLPAVCLGGDALSPISKHQTKTTARALGGGSLYWSYLPRRDQTRAIKEAYSMLHRQKLTAMYEILRRDPSVLAMHSNEG